MNDNNQNHVYVDIDSGWKYGFPKAVPDEFVKDEQIVDKDGFEKWLDSNIPEGVKVYMRRFWVA